MAKKAAAKSVKVTETGAVTPEQRKAALEAAMERIISKYGEGSVMYMGDIGKKNIEVISTGSLTLDLALGVGGLPRGRIVEIYGPESGGKTTLTLHAIAEAQRNGGTAAFIDVEHAMSPSYARKLGVDVDHLLISQPDSGEQAMEIMETLVRSGGIDIVVLDSIAALTTKAEIDGDMGDTHVGQQARLMSVGLRKLASVISKTRTVAIFINQIREKIGGYSPYGPVETTPGGRAIRFYSSIRIDIRKGEKIMDGAEQVGARTKCKVSKNKVAPPFRLCEFDMVFGKGISKVGELVDLGVILGVIRKSGAWFYYGEDRLGQGREKAKDFLTATPEFYEKIEAEVRGNASKLDFESEVTETAPAADNDAADTPDIDIENAEFSPEDLE